MLIRYDELMFYNIYTNIKYKIESQSLLNMTILQKRIEIFLVLYINIDNLSIHYINDIF